MYLRDGSMELVHVLSEQTTKSREYLLVPRVILERHLLLDLAVVDLNGAKGLQRVRRVNGLTGFPITLLHYVVEEIDL